MQILSIHNRAMKQIPWGRALQSVFLQAFQVILMQAIALGHTSSQQVYDVESGNQLLTLFIDARAWKKYILNPNDRLVMKDGFPDGEGCRKQE